MALNGLDRRSRARPTHARSIHGTPRSPRRRSTPRSSTGSARASRHKCARSADSVRLHTISCTRSQQSLNIILNNALIIDWARPGEARPNGAHTTPSRGKGKTMRLNTPRSRLPLPSSRGGRSTGFAAIRQTHQSCTAMYLHGSRLRAVSHVAVVVTVVVVVVVTGSPRCGWRHLRPSVHSPATGWPPARCSRCPAAGQEPKRSRRGDGGPATCAQAP